MKVSKLSGAQLDYWVAQAEGHRVRVAGDLAVFYEGGDDSALKERRGPIFSPSTDWRDGGPLIESRRVAVQPSPSGWDALVGKVFDDWDGLPIAPYGYGPTPLVAAMRTIIVSVYGEEVPDA